jgi:hypothetical protein
MNVPVTRRICALADVVANAIYLHCEPGGYDVSTGSPYFKYFANSDLLLLLISFIFQLLFPCGNYTGEQNLIFSLEFIYGFGRLSRALPTVQKLWKSEKK